MDSPIVPLSATQRRLWVLAQLRPQDPFYNLPVTFEIDGPLDAAVLERCLDEIVRRHPALRTAIRTVDGELVQVVDAAIPAGLPVRDLSQFPEAERASQAERIADELAREPFDLAAGHMFRPVLLRLGGDRHKLVACTHHSVFDGISAAILQDELAALYEAFAAGDPSPLPQPPDYRQHWERQVADVRREAGDSLKYWTKRLTGAPDVMELPLKGPRPARTEFEASRRIRLIPEAVVAPLERVARESGATMFMVLQAACATLLHQHGAPDVVMGTALSGRDTRAGRRLVGYLAKPVVLRTEFADDPRFTEVLARTRGDVLDAHDHPDLAFEEVLRALEVANDPSYYPLYQVLFGYDQHRPPTRAQAAGLAFTGGFANLATTKVELEFTLTRTPDGLLAQLAYRTDLFEDATVERLLERLETLLERIGSNPGATVSELIQASAAERQLVVEDWNQTAVEFPDRLCIHEFVEAQTERTPGAIALQADDRTWTYLELEQAANRLARFLVDAGIRPEDRVGVYLPRSLELIAVMLGVFKAGGVFVPLDAGLPTLRLRTLVTDAGIGLVLADPEHVSMFDDLGARVVGLDRSDRGWLVGDLPTDRVASPVVSSNAAYILFTSGSTGGPKGVVLEHRNLINIITWAHRELGTELWQSVPLISAMAFDVCMWEIFTALGCGGRVVVAEDALALARTRGAETATVITAVPSIWAELLKIGGLPTTARTVFSNGEVLPPSVLRDLYALPGVETVYNMCAPTETTTFSLFNVVRPGEPIPLGRPMHNTTAYVLDAQMRPVPPGVVGELYFGGAGVTRGYLSRPDLTAERFVPNPFSKRGGERLYKSGDLVRHAPDGRILFVGRADHQVKLRGARIELGEVEAALLAHPGIGEACAMVVRGATSLGDRLVAAVAPAAGTDESAVSAQGIRAALQERLPGYMVPSDIRVVPALPLLVSGKLDRKQVVALFPTPGDTAETDGTADAVEPPSSDVERAVAALWERILGHAPGATTSFFEAGGNSLTLIRLREALRDEFRQDIGVTDLFRHPTVRAMAQLLAGGAQPQTPTTGTAELGRSRQEARLAVAKRRSRNAH